MRGLPQDQRGQGGGNSDGFRLPNEGLSHAKYDAALDSERNDSAKGKKPALLERFKRWFSIRF